MGESFKEKKIERNKEMKQKKRRKEMEAENLQHKGIEDSFPHVNVT